MKHLYRVRSEAGASCLIVADNESDAQMIARQTNVLHEIEGLFVLDCTDVYLARKSIRGLQAMLEGTLSGPVVIYKTNSEERWIFLTIYRTTSPVDDVA